MMLKQKKKLMEMRKNNKRNKIRKTEKTVVEKGNQLAYMANLSLEAI